MQYSIKYSFNILEPYLTGDSILEMGPAEGVMTDLLVKTGKSLTVVEGSTLFCERLKARFNNIDIVNELFEDYLPLEKFDTIVMGHVLEHVDDPVFLLSRAKEWLKPGGHIFAAVPNAKSIHRQAQAAVKMGILKKEDELNDLDIHHGHKRVFNPKTFKKIFIDSGLSIDNFGGYWLKPLSNKQIEDTWSKKMIESFLELGREYPDIAGEIYIVSSICNM